MKNKNFTRLDRRHRGFGHWKYYVNRPMLYDQGKFTSTYASKQLFFLWRAWCWETWGASKELDEWLEDASNPMLISVCSNERWCWQNNDYNTRIYLRTDNELSQFLLKWSL